MAVVNFHDDSPRFPSEGRTMTTTRRALFPHVGGPYDGADMFVDVDESGVPAEYNVITDMTEPDHSLNPTTYVQSNQLTALYDRQEKPGGGWQFVFHNQVVNDLNMPFLDAA